MKTQNVIAALVAVLLLNACAGSSNRITEYLAGFPPQTEKPPQVALPLAVGLVVALPEDELSKPTTPSKDTLEKVAQRIQAELQASPQITIQRIFSALTIPAGGLRGLALEQVQALAKESNLTKMIVVVATSQSARKLRFWPIMENQLYVRMDAALVDVPKGAVLMTEFGQDDYVMAEAVDYVDRISFPRLYYRTFTVAGPFTIVEGDPYHALGWETFKGAADQLGMKLRQRLSPAGIP
jgi:hypothetical protein